jgi:transcriptional regulator with GAF, ATPase, and Fis domain
MDLALEGKRLGFLALDAEGKTGFTQEHVDLVYLLREPFSIAMSNALRYEEVVKLKEIVDAENRELSRELRGFSISEIVGADFGLRDVMEMVRQVAPLNSPVISLGDWYRKGAHRQYDSLHFLQAVRSDHKGELRRHS